MLTRLGQTQRSSVDLSVATATSSADAAPHASATVDSDLNETQGSCDQLRIPSSQTTPDTILSWPVFEKQWSASFTTDSVFENELSESESNSMVCRASVTSHAGSINEEMIPELIQQFLLYVHIKNPVVDAEAITWFARNAREEGIKWDAESCLVVRLYYLIIATSKKALIDVTTDPRVCAWMCSQTIS